MRGSTLLALWLLTCAPAAATAGPPASSAVADAIARAVRGRVGTEAIVTVTNLAGVRINAEADVLLAMPEPAAKIGDRMRFLLSDAGPGKPGKPPVRVGEATASVSVMVPAAKVVRAVARGELLSEEDVEKISASLDGMRLRPLPLAKDAIGARATRDLGQDAVLVHGDLAGEPVVRSGDIVRTRVRLGAVEVIGVMVAGESGDVGEIIRVVNRETKRSARARILSRGEVEVVNVR